MLANNFYNVNTLPVINWNKKLIMLNHSVPPNKISSTNITIPYCLRKFLKPANFSGKKLNKIHEPSSGGTGIKLKTASHILIETIKLNATNILESAKIKFCGINLNINPKIIASKKFETGPAMETFISPYFWSLKLYGFIGTGFAQPNKNGLPTINKSNGKITEPIGSKCFKGFKVSLPSYFAVGSPKEYAT